MSFRTAGRIWSTARSASAKIPRRAASTAPPRSTPLWRSAAYGVASGFVIASIRDQYGNEIQSAYESIFKASNDSAAVADHPDTSKSGGFRVDEATDTPFPLTLQLSTPSPLLTLVGLGVRTVSFLRVKVYSAGFYIQENTTKNLHSIPGWATYTAQHLLTPPTDPTSPTSGPQLSGEALIKNLLDQNVACAVRIVPVRNTDFNHLRDAFIRSVAARQKTARAEGTLTEDDDKRIATSTQTLKSLFPAQSLPKGTALVLLRTGTGELVVEYEGKLLGEVNDPWVSRALMLAYFADKDAVSPKLKEDVAKGFEGFMKR